jgi:hypothetical protein
MRAVYEYITDALSALLERTQGHLYTVPVGVFKGYVGGLCYVATLVFLGWVLKQTGWL